MDTEYRPLPEEYDEEFDRMLGYAFRPTEGPSEPDADGGREEEVGERRGLFSGEDLLCVCRQIYWDGTVRGRTVPIAGLAAVASPPENRRRGLVGEMLAASLREYRDRGCAFGALWPFERSFYARYGWATTTAFGSFECPVDDLAFAEEYQTGSFRRVDPDDWADLRPVYRDHARGYGLSVERPEQWWRHRIFESWGTDPYLYLLERDGRPVGYVGYTIEEEDDDRIMQVSRFAWRDPDAFLELVRFAYYHDSQVDRVRLYGHPTDLRDLLELVPGDDDVEYRVFRGPMIRAVDVAEALEAVGYPEGAEDSLVLSVSDPVLDSNDGRFLLDVADGGAHCRPIDDGADPDPDVSAGVGTLSQAAVGYRPVEALARVGDLSAGERALGRLSALFPSEDVFLRENF